MRRLTRLAIGLSLLAWSPAGRVLAQAVEYTVNRTLADNVKLLTQNRAAWAEAQALSWGPFAYRTEFRALWNTEGLLVRFEATDDSPWYTMKYRDDHLWEEEVVEVFLDLGRSGRNYAELEINPANVVCDLLMREPSPNQRSDIRWDFKTLKSRVFGMRDAAGKTTGWITVALLPWEDFRSLPSAAGINLPPQPADRWRFNVFRIKRPGGKEKPEQGAIFAAWSPPDSPSFHTPSAFRDLVFR